MKKIKINLDILLPELKDERDACVRRIIELLEGRNDIDKVHLIPGKGDKKPQLCFHYDPAALSLERVKDLAKSAGAKFTERYGHIMVSSEGLAHVRQARIIEDKIRKIAGVLEVSVSGTGVASIEFDKHKTDGDKIYKAVSAAGLREVAQPRKHSEQTHRKAESRSKENAKHTHDDAHEHSHKHDDHDHEHSHGGVFGKNTELYFSIICGALLAIGFGISFISGLSEYVSIGFYAAAYLFGGFYTTKEAIETISRGGFEIDFLMLVAAAGAAVLGNWPEGALLLFLFSFGHALEHFAMEKARKSISALTELAPKTALLKDGDDTREVEITELQKGDVIVVRPNTKISADGVVTKGASSVNQAPITGESIPVDKDAIPEKEFDLDNVNKIDSKHRVFAGTINGNDSLEVMVSKEAKDSTLSRLVKMVNEAQTQKSPTQQFTDKFEKYFVPAVLILVALLCFAFVVIDEPFSTSFYRAMSVLVAASPCALAISTPSAVLSGVARAARAGVLVKGGKPLEDLGSLTALAFDKTGTLTEGKPKLTEVVPLIDMDETELLKIVVAVEALSDHPIAKAIVRDGKEKLSHKRIPNASEMKAVLGKGIQAKVGDDKIYMGNLSLFESLDKKHPGNEVVDKVHELENSGNTAMLVRKGSEYIGIVAVMDTPRKEAKAALKKLKALGIRRMVMLTGDNQQVAEAVAKEIGISDAWGGLLPEEKVKSIKKLRKQEKKVAMVGDGVNDAPAMANSTVGIAMGAAGSDVALETADIALMGDKLELLPFAIGLSRKAKRIIKQNLVVSLGAVAVLIPLTISGIASIGPAIVAHEGSTLLVVFNALRLLAYKSKSSI